jgi:hypothetical protein
MCEGDSMIRSKTFEFSSMDKAVQFVKLIDEEGLGIRAWIGKRVRVTVTGAMVLVDIVKIDKLADSVEKDRLNFEWEDKPR